MFQNPSFYSILLVAGILIILASCSTLFRLKKKNTRLVNTFPIAEVVSQVKQEISAAQSVPIGGPKLRLKAVELDLSIVNTETNNTNFGLGVPTIDVSGNYTSSIEKNSTSQVKLSLEPPKPVELASSAELNDMRLAETIINVRRQLKKGFLEEPILNPKTVDFVIKFGVVESAKIDGDIEIFILSINPSSEFKVQQANTITVKFVGTN